MEGTEVVQGGVTSGVAEYNPVETQLQPEKLEFCQCPDWDKEKTYDEDPPSYIYYSIATSL